MHLAHLLAKPALCMGQNPYAYGIAVAIFGEVTL